MAKAKRKTEGKKAKRKETAAWGNNENGTTTRAENKKKNLMIIIKDNSGGPLNEDKGYQFMKLRCGRETTYTSGTCWFKRKNQ